MWSRLILPRDEITVNFITCMMLSKLVRLTKSQITLTNFHRLINVMCYGRTQSRPHKRRKRTYVVCINVNGHLCRCSLTLTMRIFVCRTKLAPPENSSCLFYFYKCFLKDHLWFNQVWDFINQFRPVVVLTVIFWRISLGPFKKYVSVLLSNTPSPLL